MQRIRSIMGLTALLGLGAASALGGPYMSQYWNKGAPDGVHWGPQYLPDVPTVQGAWGEPVPVAAPYNVKPPNGTEPPAPCCRKACHWICSSRAAISRIVPCPFSRSADSARRYVSGSGRDPPGNLISPPGIGGSAAGRSAARDCARPAAVAAVGL